MRLIRNLALALAAAALFAMPARAANTYTIVQNQSQLNLTAGGTILGSTLTITEQQANAITRYNGTVQVGFNGSPAPNGAINFPGGSAAAAVNPTGGFFNTPLPFSPNVNGGAGTTGANYGVTVSAAVGIAIPAFDVPVGDTTISLNLGTLQSFDMKLAVRDLVLDVEGGNTGIGAGGVFDANATSIGIDSGFADLNGSLVFNTGSYANRLVVQTALTALVGAVPDLGLVVTAPSLLNFTDFTVSLGLGTRIDLAGLAGTAVPNLAATDGSVSFVNLATPSTLILPVDISLPSLEDAGLPPEILDLQLGLSGQLRATGLIVDVPEPSSVVLGAIAVTGLALVARRRRRSA